jgi:Cytochrome P450
MAGKWSPPSPLPPDVISCLPSTISHLPSPLQSDLFSVPLSQLCSRLTNLQFLGDGIFNADSHIWSNARALLRPQFHRQRVSDLHVFEDHISKMMDLLPTDGKTIDLMEWWFRFTLDASTDYLFGESVESLVNPKVFIPRPLGLITLIFPPASLSYIPLLLSLRTSRYPAQLASLNLFFNPIFSLLFTPPLLIVSKSAS